MKSKLEEKIKEAADSFWLGIESDEDNKHSANQVIEAFTQGAQFGITVYKEMLEGVGVEGAETILVGYPDGEWAEIMGDGYSEKDGCKKFIEAKPVLAKLQQQAEKITELEKDKSIHLATMKGQINLNEQLSAKNIDLESRLKEADSVIERFKKSKSMGDIYELKYEVESKFKTKGE